MSSIFGGSIRSKVMARINEKIDRAQKLHDIEVAHLKITKRNKIRQAFTQFILGFNTAIAEFNQKREEAEQNHINNILSKIL